MKSENSTERRNKKINPVIISLIVITLIAIAAGATYLATRDDDNRQAPATQTTTTAPRSNTDTPRSVTTTTSVPSSYADGTYSATGSYSTPGGTESITVKVALVKDIVASIDTTGSARGGNAAQYQSAFLSNYKTHVVGKSIDTVSLSRVAGSSLTSNGFNTAIEDIKNDARS